jgi:hypothetical protein
LAKKVRKKQGIILISTIFLMGVLIVIIGINTEITKKNFDLYNHSKLVHQNNILISNIISVLKSKSSFVSNKETFDILLAQNINFKDKKSGIKVSIKFTPDNKKININNLIIYSQENNDITKVTTKYNQHIYDIIAQLLYKKSVVDVDYFLDILADSIDKDLEPRASLSEIAYKDNRFENGFVASLGHLDKIKEHYIKQTTDTNILKVDFDKYFRFDDAKIDINYIDPSLLSQITKIDIQEIKQILDKNESIVDLSDAFGIEHNNTFNALNIKTKSWRVICGLDITVYEKKTKAIFKYDFEKKEASDIKIYY